MKRNLLFGIFSMFLLTACSSDDSNNSGNTTDNNYFPVENGQFWVYDVMGEYAGRDSLYVANDTTINNTSYKKFKTKELAFGFFSTSLAGNGVRKSGDKVLVSGSTNVNLIEGFPIDLVVNDFVFFKENASDNEPLSFVSGTFNYQYGDIPLTFDYSMKSVFQESLTNFTVPNRGTYQDVKVVKVFVNLKVDGVVPVQNIPFPLAIMKPQDVVVSTQYYAKNIGMIYSNTQINYQLENPAQIGNVIPFPTSGSQNINEYLDNHTPNLAN